MEPMRRKMLVSALVAFVAVCGIAGGTSRPAWAQAGSPVALDVLNEPIPGTTRIMVVQGDPVEVYFDVEPLARTSPADQIQLRRIEDGDVVSHAVRGEELSGTVPLSTIPENALGWLEVAYVLQPTGVVLATSEEKVLVVAEAPPEPPAIVTVPSAEAPTLQAAVELVADGGAVMVEDGVYEVDQPIFVIGKSITIEGAGSSRGGGAGGITRLEAPAPTEVVEAELAMGVINYIGGGGVLRDVDLSGGDACVVGRDLEGSGTAFAIEDVCMSNTGRGVLWKAQSELTVVDSDVENCMWNGIVFAPALLTPSWPATFSDVFMQDVDNIGYLVVGQNAHFENLYVDGCKSGGIVLYDSVFEVVDCFLVGNTLAGIAAYKSYGAVTDSFIWLTNPVLTDPGQYSYGDGMSLWMCVVIVGGNHIGGNDRSAVANFGSTVYMDSNQMACNGFDMQLMDVPAGAFGPSEPPLQVKAHFHDLGGNLCGCAAPPTEACELAMGPGLEPPAPVAPVE